MKRLYNHIGDASKAKRTAPACYGITIMSLIVIALAFLPAAGVAQAGKTTFGVRAGINFQNLNGKDAEGDKLDNKLKTGFNAGVNAEVPVAEDFYVQPGVLFSTKGARTDNPLGGDDLKVGLSYIEVPVNFIYKPVLGKGNLIMGLGPYVAFGVGGAVELGDFSRDIEWEKEITAVQAMSGTPYFRRFDAGGNLLFGYQLSNSLSAQLNAQLGLLNINPEVEGTGDETAIKNTGFGISLGYRFGGR